ncbi:aromatic di-alanine and TPR containing protein, partial [Rhizoctonia solani 123E]
ADDLHDLGWSRLEKFRDTGTLRDLDQAFEYFSRAVALTPEEHPDLAERLNSLGASYTDRFQRMGDLDDLHKAVDCDSRALALTDDDHPH